ncbi:hypothetical protein V6N11_036990 [Hibiscus sabdariffa]|uniref:SOSEKI DIX-like domain-containing protein n=1 Tax=Hibiscus sabdariffa TaxID=183260 RepID=A0ABR2RC07_9ROSI
MPSLYSWSCKRTYKNGYVWNDLADNDVIPPSDEDEYVLKGSELVDERLHHIQISKMEPVLQVSTDELEYQQHSSSIISEKQVQSNNTTSKWFEDGEPVANVSASGRKSSVLLQLIAGGESDVKLRLGTLILEP